MRKEYRQRENHNKRNSKQQDTRQRCKWYFRFLKLKCKVKSNENISDDSEIKELLRHYEHSDEKNILSQVYYCAGCIYGALGDQPQAIDYFYKTLETIQDDKENWLKALCYYQLGNRYSLQDLYAEALPWQEKSLKEHMKSNNLIRSIYDYEELAWTEGNLGNTERALKYILEAKKQHFPSTTLPSFRKLKDR